MNIYKHLTVFSILLITYDSILLLAGFGFIKGSSFVGDFLQDETANLVLSSVGSVVGSILLVVSIPGIAAGIGLIYRKSWSRVVALVVCALKLFNIPFGTALGIYGFWVLMQDETIKLLKSIDP